MKTKIIIPTLTALAISSSIISFIPETTNAQTNNNSSFNEKLDSTEISDNLIEKATKYISIDNDKNFVLDIDKAKNTLSNEELNLVKERLSETNKLTDESNFDVVDNHLVTKSKVNKTTMLRATSEGINKVEVYWWGYKIWLSKTTVHKLLNVGSSGAGTYLGGVIGASFVGSKAGVYGAVIGGVAGAVATEFINPAAARAIYMEVTPLGKVRKITIFNK